MNLFQTDMVQKVSDERGIMLADRCGASYTKHSSKSGSGTNHIMRILARQLAIRKLRVNRQHNFKCS
jgi:hypothetical protein